MSRTATGILGGTVTDSVSGHPVPGVEVSAGAFSAITLGTGNYSIEVPSGTYDVTVSAYGYASQTLTGVVIGDGATVDQDFAIVAEKTVQVSGTVVDGSGANWPLYAKVRIAPLSGPVQTVYTNSATGQYQATVFANSTLRPRGERGGERLPGAGPPGGGGYRGPERELRPARRRSGLQRARLRLRRDDAGLGGLRVRASRRLDGDQRDDGLLLRAGMDRHRPGRPPGTSRAAPGSS